MLAVIRQLLLFVSYFFLVFLAGSCNQHEASVPEMPETGVYSTDEDDEEMTLAILNAKRTADKFIQTFNNRKDRPYGEFYVKFPFARPGGWEHLWLRVLSAKPGAIKGVVENESSVTNLQWGDTITVQQNEISDWTYLDTLAKKMYGGYTLALIRSRMTESEQKDFDDQLGAGIVLPE